MAKKIANEEIRKIVGSKRNIIQQIKESILNLFGHICRMEDNRLVKEVVFREMEGKRQEEDCSKNGWMIFRNGATKRYMN